MECLVVVGSLQAYSLLVQQCTLQWSRTAERWSTSSVLFRGLLGQSCNEHSPVHQLPLCTMALYWLAVIVTSIALACGSLGMHVLACQAACRAVAVTSPCQSSLPEAATVPMFPSYLALPNDGAASIMQGVFEQGSS